MTLDERFAEFHSVIDAEIARARREGIADVLRVAARIRRASSEAERAVAFEDARQTFDGNATVLDFLKTLAALFRLRFPARGDRICGRSDSRGYGWRRFSFTTRRR